MPVSVVVGGQFGSEGKGKVALELARLRGAVAAIRVGGPNSGHTAVDATGRAHVFRHLPTAALLPDVTCVIAAGSYIDPDVLLDEISRIDLLPSCVLIDPWAVLIEPNHREQERQSGLKERIGSTLSGTGAAVAARVQRRSELRFAKDERRFAAFVQPVKPWLRSQLRAGARIIIEGTQGFGLSLLHSEHYPYVTSRDTTAAAFVAEAGLGPLDVDEVALVIRAFPIRVAGASGNLPDEIDWRTVTEESGSRLPLKETTSVTGRVRRVARFDAGVVRRAIAVNGPTLICCNHVDYVDTLCLSNGWTAAAEKFVTDVEVSIDRRIDYIGLDAATMIPRPIEGEIVVPLDKAMGVV
jgi:adenylosuccinate synthase